MAIEHFIEYLKSKKLDHYICDNCTYSQGHQILFCQKCSGKMRRVQETEYDSFMRSIDRNEKAVKRSTFYKNLYSGDNWISFDEWASIVDEIKNLC